MVMVITFVFMTNTVSNICRLIHFKCPKRQLSCYYNMLCIHFKNLRKNESTLRGKWKEKELVKFSLKT